MKTPTADTLVRRCQVVLDAIQRHTGTTIEEVLDDIGDEDGDDLAELLLIDADFDVYHLVQDLDDYVSGDEDPDVSGEDPADVAEREQDMYDSERGTLDPAPWKGEF